MYTWLYGVALSCRCSDCVPSEGSRANPCGELWIQISCAHTLLMWWAVLIVLPWQALPSTLYQYSQFWHGSTTNPASVDHVSPAVGQLNSLVHSLWILRWIKQDYTNSISQLAVMNIQCQAQFIFFLIKSLRDPERHLERCLFSLWKFSATAAKPSPHLNANIYSITFIF